MKEIIKRLVYLFEPLNFLDLMISLNIKDYY